MLSFGATKNGALTAEAVVFFNRELAQTMRYRRRRGGHLFSKMRFLSVQLAAFIDNGLWLRNARHANAMAQRVRDGLAKIPGVRFPSPTEINLVLVALPQPVWDGLVAEGYSFSRRGRPQGGRGADRVRLRHHGRGGGRAGRDRAAVRRRPTGIRAAGAGHAGRRA